MSLQQVTNAYAAGLFDGEGTLSIQHYWPTRNRNLLSWRLYASVSSVDRAGVEWLAAHYAGWIGLHAQRPSHHRPVYRWSVGSGSAERFLRAIGPYTIIKRERISIALTFAESLWKPGKPRLRITPDVAAHRDSLKEQIRVLNQRGRPP